MKINDRLLNDESFKQNLINSFASIEQNIKEGTLWNCGVASKGVVILKKNDKIIDKIVFLVKKFFGYIDTSHSSIEKLKLRIYFAELTNLAHLTDKINEAKSTLETTNQSVRSAETTFRTKLYELNNIEKNINDLKTELETKEKKFEVVEEKLRAIAEAEELETKLQTQRTVNQAIITEIEKISENLGGKHDELIENIGKTDLGLDGWIKNADNLIQEKEQALSRHLSELNGFCKEERLVKIINDVKLTLNKFQKRLETLKQTIPYLTKDLSGLTDLLYNWIRFENQQITDKERKLDSYLPLKPRNSLEVVLNKFRNKLQSLKEQIPLITNSKEYAEFLSELKIIETSGWSDVHGNQKYTVEPDSLSPLQKTILCEIRELADLTFRRKQIMGLRT